MRRRSVLFLLIFVGSSLMAQAQFSNKNKKLNSKEKIRLILVIFG